MVIMLYFCGLIEYNEPSQNIINNNNNNNNNFDYDNNNSNGENYPHPCTNLLTRIFSPFSSLLKHSIRTTDSFLTQRLPAFAASHAAAYWLLSNSSISLATTSFRLSNSRELAMCFCSVIQVRESSTWWPLSLSLPVGDGEEEDEGGFHRNSGNEQQRAPLAAWGKTWSLNRL